MSKDDLKQVRAKAKELLKGYCRVCPVCDGRACAGELPGMGGVGSGASFMNNVRALSELKFNMRVLHGVSQPDTSCELFGLKLSMPVLAAPITGMKHHLGEPISEDDYAQAVLSGCQDAGALGCVGDGTQPEFLQAGGRAIEAVEGRALAFVKPWPGQEFFDALKVVSGAAAVGSDLDGAGFALLRLRENPVRPWPPAKLKQVVERLDKPFIVKGVMTPDEAELCAQAGAAGIVVSNHGGRVLDQTPGTAQVLPAIARAVKGSLSILADGGVRSGGDVLKMLALGADGVLIGRPIIVAAVGGGRQGVAGYLKALQRELVTAMILTGVADVGQAGPEILWRG